MGCKVIWTDEAIADLRQVVVFISRDNQAAAIKLGEEIIRKSMMLENHPRMGRMLREPRRDNLREIVISPYRLIYEIDDSSQTIFMRVLWHGARQEPDIK